MKKLGRNFKSPQVAMECFQDLDLVESGPMDDCSCYSHLITLSDHSELGVARSIVRGE